MAGVPVAQSATVNQDPQTPAPDATPEIDNNSSTNLTDQKKDRKPRRDRLPLPDPIPETPVKRYPEPNKADLQARVEAEDAKLQQCFDLLSSTRSFYDQRQKIRDSGKPAFENARKVFTDLNDRCRSLFEERKSITAQLKAIKEADIAARSSSNSKQIDIPGAGRDNLEALKDVKTMEDLENRIERYKYRQETESMSMSEEKKIVATISFLQNKGRDHIRNKAQSIKDEKAAKEAREASRAKLEESLKSLDATIDDAKEKLDIQKKVVDEIRSKQDEEIQKLQEQTAHIDRDAEKKKIGELKAAINKMRDDYQKEHNEWYLNERIYFEQQKINRRKKEEARQAEREARRKAWEAEQAQYPEPHPYQEEKDMCAGLTVYLQTILGETVDKEPVNLRPSKGETAPSLKPTSNSRAISSEGKTIGKRSIVDDEGGFENLAFSDFVKKTGKSKGKKGRSRASAVSASSKDGADDTALKPHSIDLITAFTRLDIKPPNKISEVRTALEAVKAKAAYYETAPAPSEEEKAKKIEGKKKQNQRSEKKTANESDIMNEDNGANAFPGLQSDAAAPTQTRDASMPSFMAVASGVATAPTPVASAPVESAVADVGNMKNEQLMMENMVQETAVGADELQTAPPELPITEA